MTSRHVTFKGQTRNISKTAGDIDSVVKKNYQQEMVYGLSNAHVADDVM